MYYNNTMHKYDFLIVGSGLYGSTFAYLANKLNKKCLVIDKRNHLGGNIYCNEQNGIQIHTYGAHIFHTSNKTVWDFVNQFVSFNRYTNSPIANYNGKIYNLPFNMNTFYQLWKVKSPIEAKTIINEQIKKYGVKEPKNLEEQAINLVGKDIYEVLIKEYTQKQWGRDCKTLPSFIIKRLPVRFTFDNNYFDDLYQGIPIQGYNSLIHGLLNGIETKLSVDYFSNRNEFNQLADKIVFTGQIDEFFDYKFGFLEYRSVEFQNETIDLQNFQGNAVINYTSLSEPFTRIIEHKHFQPESDAYMSNQTVISKEFSKEWKKGMEPFYPINDARNNEIYQKYAELALCEKNVIFGGRLAEYKYYDMDDVIEKAINDFNNYYQKKDF